MKALLMGVKCLQGEIREIAEKGHSSSGERNTGSSETVKGTILTELICFMYVIFINLELF